MATTRTKKVTRTVKKAGRSTLAEVQALAARLQRELERRRRVARGTLNTLERDLRALARALSKRANAVAADVEKHIRGVRRDLQAPARARTRRSATRKRK